MGQLTLHGVCDVFARLLDREDVCDVDGLNLGRHLGDRADAGVGGEEWKETARRWDGQLRVARDDLATMLKGKGGSYRRLKMMTE